MPRLPQLIGADDIDDAQKWVLLDVLFAPTGPITASVAILGACLVAWMRGHSTWVAVWALSTVIALVVRVGLTFIYRQRARSGDPHIWSNVFYAASCLTGLQWGLGGMGILAETDGSVLGTILGVECALLAGAATRGHNHPGAAFSQIAIAATEIAVSSIFAEQWMLVAIMALYVIYQASFIKTLAWMSLSQLLWVEDRKKLVQKLEDANERLACANAQLEDMSLTDALTQVGNRRCFDRDLHVAWQSALMGSTHLSLGLIDVDHFKRFNDEHGHLAGDACLALVAAAISQGAQSSGARVYRYGGEEFAVLLQDTRMDVVHRVATRITEAVRAIDLTMVANPRVKITVSVGLAELSPNDAMPISILFARADEALYGAKHSGRDCIQAHGSQAVSIPMQQRPDLRVA